MGLVMTHLQAIDVAFQYQQHAEPLFKNISVSFSNSTRAALVGENGAGKSTFCAMLSGGLNPTSGRIVNTGMSSIELFSSEALEKESDLFNYFSTLNVEIYSKEFIAAMAEWQVEFDQIFQPLYSWSGGQKVRALLAVLFLKQPSFIILDEPTSHLDHSGIALLERHLQRTTCGYLIISHNRDFLDRTTTSTLWLENQCLTSYGTTITHCLQQRESELQKAIVRKSDLIKSADRLRMMQREKQLNGQKMDRFKAERSVKNNGGICQRDEGSGSSSVNTGKPMRQAKVLGDKVRHLEAQVEGLVLKKSKSRKLCIKSESAKQHALITWDRKDLKAPGTDETILSQISLSIGSSERIAFCGPNGCGKSLLLGEIFIELQSKGVSVGMISQVLPDLGDTTVLDFLGGGNWDLLEHALNTLGSLHVPGCLRTQQFSTLSSGEKTKVVLAKSFASAPAVLILDEVTNHVSMIDLMAIEQALNNYLGALIVVSHDTAFVRNLGCKLVEMREFQIAQFTPV